MNPTLNLKGRSRWIARVGRVWSIGLTIALAACVSANATEQHCPTSIDEAQLQLDYDRFDAAGWRELLAGGCVDAAVAQLESYRQANGARLTQDQQLELPFHIGQALAFSGRDEDSIRYFEQARGGSEEWAAYVEATLAFLKHDAAGLEIARANYARAPGSSEMRLQVIDGFARCATSPYAQAAMCGMSR